MLLPIRGLQSHCGGGPWWHDELCHFLLVSYSGFGDVNADWENSLSLLLSIHVLGHSFSCSFFNWAICCSIVCISSPAHPSTGLSAAPNHCCTAARRTCHVPTPHSVDLNTSCPAVIGPAVIGFCLGSTTSYYPPTLSFSSPVLFLPNTSKIRMLRACGLAQ